MELHLAPLDQTLLIITSTAITVFFILGIVAVSMTLALISKIKSVVRKAEEAIDSVEEATQTIKNIGAQAGGPLAIFKIMKNIYDTFNRKK